MHGIGIEGGLYDSAFSGLRENGDIRPLRFTVYRRFQSANPYIIQLDLPFHCSPNSVFNNVELRTASLPEER